MKNYSTHYLCKEPHPWKCKTLEPIARLTKKNEPLTWGKKEESFTKIIADTTEALMLSYPKWDKPFKVHANAIGMAVKEIVLQNGVKMWSYAFPKGLVSIKRTIKCQRKNFSHLLKLLSKIATFYMEAISKSMQIAKSCLSRCKTHYSIHALKKNIDFAGQWRMEEINQVANAGRPKWGWDWGIQHLSIAN